MAKKKQSIVYLFVIVVALAIYILNNLPANNNNIVVKEELKVKVLNDRDYFSTILDFIDRANKSIHVIMYSYKTDTDTIEIITEKLIAASRRGVEVKVVLESDVDYNELVYQRLLQNNVQVKYDSRAHTTHCKLVIIDGYIVIVGSHNWSKSAMMLNHESSVLIVSEEVGKQEEVYFNNVWIYG